MLNRDSILGQMVNELRRIFSDVGVTVIFIVATLAYPFLYKGIYWNEQITDVPVAVVDLSNSTQSRAFLHRWSAAPDIKLTHSCTSMAEAEQLLFDESEPALVEEAAPEWVEDPDAEVVEAEYAEGYVVFPLYEGYLSLLQPSHAGVDA